MREVCEKSVLKYTWNSTYICDHLKTNELLENHMWKIKTPVKIPGAKHNIMCIKSICVYS